MEPDVSAVCPPLSALSKSYREDRLSPEERRQFRAHLSSCEPCRSRAIAADPTMIFAVAPAPAPTDAAESRAILENVKAAVAIREASRRLDRSAGVAHGRRAATAVGAAALLALAFSAPLVRRPISVAAAASPRSSRISNAATKIVRPGAEDSSSMPSSATIYEWNPGTTSPDDPKIVWIVDRSLDL